jgi:hypothetical protein
MQIRLMIFITKFFSKKFETKNSKIPSKLECE